MRIGDRIARNLLRAAALLFLAALLLYGFGVYWMSRVDWTPLTLPIVLEKGQRTSGSFKGGIDVPHLLTLQTTRNLEFQRQNCLLGIEILTPDRCVDVPAEVDIAWAVTAQGKTIAEGQSGAHGSGSWGPTIGRNLGDFPVERARVYNVSVTVRRSSPELQNTLPKLVVEVPASRFKDAFVLSSIAGLIAILVAIGSVLFVVAAGGRLLWVRKHSKPVLPTQ